MATVNRWIGATTVWDTGTNWSGGAKPANGEVVLFNGGSVVSVATTQDNEQGVTLAGLIIEPTYTGDIGSSGVALQIGCQTGNVLHRGSGKLYLKCGTTFTSPIIIDCVNKTTQVELDCTTVAGTDVEVVRGTVALIGGSAATEFNRVVVGWRDDPINDVTMTIASTVTSGSVDLLVINGGVVTNSETTAMCVLSGHGRLVQSAGVVTDLVVVGGRCNWDFANGASDAATRVYVVDGIFDFTQTQGQKIINTLYEFPNGEVVRMDDNDIHKITTHRRVKTRFAGE